MNRKQAMTIILAEAFSEAGIAMLMENGEEPGWARINHLIEALNFLTNDLEDEDSFGREFVSALFVHGNRVPELMRNRNPDGPGFRPSLYSQAEELTIAVTALIENWSHWPDWETYEPSQYPFAKPAEESRESSRIEQVGGYRLGDITYCLVSNTMECFPVRIERLGNGWLDVVPLLAGIDAGAEFMQESSYRCFYYPLPSPGARFGSDDERLVNSHRKSGSELRLLPVDYASKTLDLIRERHATDPVRWPLPTGFFFERWFQDRNDRRE